MEFHLSHKEEVIWEHVKHTSSFVFQTLLFLFLITLIVKEFYPEINSYVNINWFMLVVIIFGAFTILFPPANIKKKEEEPNIKHLIFIIMLGILGAIIIFFKIKTLGWISYLIAGLGGVIIILLSWLILTEKEDEHSHKSPQVQGSHIHHIQ